MRTMVLSVETRVCRNKMIWLSNIGTLFRLKKCFNIKLTFCIISREDAAVHENTKIYAKQLDKHRIKAV